MSAYSVVLFAAIVAAIMEKCTTRYLLLKIGDAGERTKSNLSVDLLKELNVEKDNRRESIEWLHFQHLETDRYIGNPEKTTDFIGLPRDGGKLVIGKSSAGRHAITDTDGTPLKLSDVKDGMQVKIRAEKVNWEGYDYLFTSESNPSWGYCYYTKLDPNEFHPSKSQRKQTWVVQKHPTDAKFHFESRFWSKGNFLSGNQANWLYVDDDRDKDWWKVTLA